MSYAKIKEYRGIKIAYTNIANTAGNEGIPAFDSIQKIIKEFPDKSALSLVNATDAKFNKDLLAKIKETVKKNNPKIKATAVCGLNKLSTLILNSIISATGRKMKLVNTEEEALEWLYNYEMNGAEIAVS